MSGTTARPMFIVFEGLDGAGKTSLARRTAESIDAEFLTTPSLALRPYRDVVVASFGGCQEACQLFYLATVFAAAREVRAHLDAGRSVVLDRYLLSTQAYAAFRGSALELDHLASLLVPADLTVFVDAPLAVRVERLAQRGTTAADRETMSPDADARLHVEYSARMGLAITGQVLHLDSASASVDSLVPKVVEAITRRVSP